MKSVIAVAILTTWTSLAPVADRAQAEDDSPGGAGATRDVPARFKDTNRIQLRYEWNIKTTVGAYETAGSHDPKWDADATESFVAFSRIRSLPIRVPQELIDRCHAAADRAIKSGCIDPLVQYLKVRYGNPGNENAAGYARLVQQTADDLAASSYPPVRKFWAHFRAGEYTPPALTNSFRVPPEVTSHRLSALTNLVRATRDTNMPIEEVYNVADSLLDQVKGVAALHARVWNAFEYNLFKNWPDEDPTHLLKGEYHVAFAWKGRGNATAERLTDENMRLFRERTEIARAAFAQAWKLNDQDERIPLGMLQVAYALGSERPEMERWFDRAMALKPDYIAACRAKAQYLEPRWHGTMPELIAFGRQCVTNRQWTGSVPLLLIGIHSNLYLYTPREQRPAYWKHPAVWPDLKFTYDNYLKRNSTNHNQRAGYIRHAALCGQWGTVREQLPLLTHTNYSVFGGPSEFQRIVREAAIAPP